MRIMKFKRLSNSQRRDLICYIKFSESVKIAHYEPTSELQATTLEEWYFLWDTHGKKASYKDLELCGKIIQAKATLNLTIKMWVEDVKNELLFIWEVWEYCVEYPDWVWKAFCGQVEREDLIFSFQRLNFAPDNK